MDSQDCRDAHVLRGAGAGPGLGTDIGTTLSSRKWARPRWPVLASAGPYWIQLLKLQIGRKQSRTVGLAGSRGWVNRNGEHAEREGHPIAGSLPLPQPRSGTDPSG